jgi:hypothetical protein
LNINLLKVEGADSNRNKERAAKVEYGFSNAEKLLYPSLPDPPLPHSLSLKDYTGTYYHPAYHNVTLTLRASALYAFRNVTLPTEFTLKHASGDYFTAYCDSTTAPGGIFRKATTAEFVVSSSGVASSFGIAAEPALGDGVKIWFERV